MSLTTQISAPVIQASALPQIVPSSTCLRCDVCCRFPDPDSLLRPYFTGSEIARAVAGGVDARSFPSPSGGQISLIPDEQGEGFHCPAFDPATAHCRIYAQRPLDCQLYPLALMWNERHDEVVLGWDVKCPFMREQIPGSIQEHAGRVAELLKRPDIVGTICSSPRLIGRFQEDVVQLSSIPQITLALSERWGDVTMHRFTLEDLPRMRAALDRSGLPAPQSLAAYHAAYHYMCNAVLPYWWTELQGAFCLFIESPDGWFMPLPPLTDGPIEEPLAAAFAVMRRRNGYSPVSRVENLTASLASRLRSLGYHCLSKDSDYLYQADELAVLAGARYKSQRALCNRLERVKGIEAKPYTHDDRTECRTLLRQWQGQKLRKGLDLFGRLLLDDASSTHEVVWSHAEALGIGGTVVRIDGILRAYTFGYWLTNKTWCVLLEVADRTVSGLAQYLFRETCRTASSRGAAFINAMDDAGLSGLRLSKQAYHPMDRIENFILSESRGA